MRSSAASDVYKRQGQKYKRTLSLCDSLPVGTEGTAEVETEVLEVRGVSQRHQGAEEAAALPDGVSQAQSQTPRSQGVEQ